MRIFAHLPRAELGDACLTETTAMQMEGFDQAGRNLAAEAIAAESALKEFDDQQESEWKDLQNRFVHDDTAMDGMAAAVPVSLALWMAIGALLWAVTR